MRSLVLRDQISSKTRASFLVALLFVTMLQVALKHGMRELPEDGRPSKHAAPVTVLLTSMYPMLSEFRVPRPSVEHTIPSEAVVSKSSEENLVITQLQRSLHIVYRLSRFHGTGRGFSRIKHITISCIGILGMFAAIVGAVIGPWLVETCDDSDDDDRFAFWVREEDEDDDDERICGVFREERYSLLRLLDVP